MEAVWVMEVIQVTVWDMEVIQVMVWDMEVIQVTAWDMEVILTITIMDTITVADVIRFITTGTVANLQNGLTLGEMSSGVLNCFKRNEALYAFVY